MNAPYKEVAQSIAFLQQEQQKAIQTEQARLDVLPAAAAAPAPPPPDAPVIET